MHPALPPRDRRQLLRWASAWPLAALGGCATPWPELPVGAASTSARSRLHEAAEAHGLAAWRQLHDLNARLSQPWPAVLQPGAGGPDPVAPLELRLLRATGHTTSRTALSGTPASRPLAALQADAHRLLLLGPLAVVDQATVVNWGSPETLDGQRCDQLHLDLAPGLGGGAPDKLSLYIDREHGWLRRLRVALPSAAGQPGPAPVAEVDFFAHLLLHGVLWPRRFQAPAGGLLPGAVPQTWRLTGLDLNRGYGADALAGTSFSGAAAAPAHALPGG